MGIDGISIQSRMKKSIQYYFYCLLCFTLISPLLAQLPAELTMSDRFWNDKSSTKVIAKNGLIVRSGPSAKSDRLGKLNFGAHVKYLENDVKILENLYEEQTETRTIKVRGAWRKIEFEGQAGYVNSAFLYPPLHQSRIEPNMNNDYVILMTGANCINNTHKPSNYNWYGYYNTGNQSCRLTEVSIEYCRSESAGYSDLHVVVKEDQDLMFIIGSKTKLSAGEINEWSSIGYYNKYHAYKINHVDSLLVDDPYFEIVTRKENERFKPYGILKYGDLRQDITVDAYGHINGYNFIGDLDGDNRPDYVISYGEKDGRTVLYLSSKREAGQIAKAVACYYTAYCC